MEFRTNLNINEISKPKNPISYEAKIGLIGSCFVENIGEKLNYYKFSNWINPNGILFHPLAIEKALSAVVSKKEYSKADLIYDNERWHSMDHHSDFSSLDAAKTLGSINTSLQNTFEALQTTSHLIITLGTAWVYHHIATDNLVANCHKIPQKEFVKRLLSVTEIVASLQNSIDLVKKINPKLEVILTLSPIRHLKDGMLANSRSKAHLLAAIHQVVDTTTHYFPSYEIMLDDLRNYRFYSSDMLHPNEVSVAYIWTIFKEIWISPKSFDLMEQVAQVQRDLQHKAFNPSSEKHNNFLKKLDKKKETLYNLYGISF